MIAKTTMHELQGNCLVYKQCIYDILKAFFKDYIVEKVASQFVIKLHSLEDYDKIISFHIHFNLLEDDVEYLFITEFNNSLFYIVLPPIEDKLLIETNIKAYLSGLLWDLLEPKE